MQAAKGRKLSDAEKAAIKTSAEGDAGRSPRPDRQQLGGTVLADYQVAYNGIKVQVDRSKLDELAALPGVTAVRAIQLMSPTTSRRAADRRPAVWAELRHARRGDQASP